MTQFVKVLNDEKQDLTIPDGFVLVASDSQQRNGETVRVERYQAGTPVVMNGPHVTVVYGEDDRLISYNNFAVELAGKRPSNQEATAIAERVFDRLDPVYARRLSFMRVDHLSRYYNDADGRRVEIPILWVKFAHSNGSYNWVSVGADGFVVEVERESEWDYFRSRRSTEEWNYDDWVLARMGKGPQPPAPEALA